MPLLSPRPLAESLFSQLVREPVLQAHRIQLPAKALVYRPQDPAENIYFIHSGQVRTYQNSSCGSRRLVEILGSGEWCGSAALARLEQYGESAEAIVPTLVSVVQVERLLAALPQEPGLANELIRQLAGKLTTFREDASELVFEDCSQRLVRTLVTLSASPAATPAEEGVVVHITHQQLAQKVGVARETVSLALAQLRRQNLLRTGRNQLFFSPQSLREWNVMKSRPINGTKPQALPNAQD